MTSVTIQDVAERAGVGVGTVSRVLNDSPSVRETTRQKVLAAIAALDYSPNPFARRLSLGKTLTIGAVAPFFTRPSFVERLRGVEAALADTKYDLLVYNVETPEKRDRCLQEAPRSRRVDGLLIIAFPPSDDDVARFAAAELPVVLINDSPTSLSRVMVDDVKGGYIATYHLLELGHRKIAYISDPLTDPFNFTSSRYRYQGYRQALDEYDVPFRDEYHRADEHGREQAREMTHQLLDLDDPPTAIFAASDTQAMGVLEAARERDIPIPDALSVIGYDDIEIAEYLDLTTIRQPLFESGWRGTQLLLHIITNAETETLCEQLPIELVERRTTATLD
ncbi:MAG: LacI family transcriptional regulator [Chloroflexi bacterium]|nr:MAG: LacI family transcriptional regulator [Chloroflexota bacterium]RLC85205.1 MAG: LacI family transcriptional regulator [Chloroflexota bacterium]